MSFQRLQAQDRCKSCSVAEAASKMDFDRMKNYINSGDNIETKIMCNGIDASCDCSALMFSCLHGNLPMVKYLLSIGAKVNDVNSDSTCVTALSLSLDDLLSRDSIRHEIVKLLIEKGANINNIDGEVVVDWAMQNYYFDILKLCVKEEKLFSRMKSKTYDDKLMAFVRQIDPSLNVFVSAAKNNRKHSLIESCELGLLDTVKVLVQKEISINPKYLKKSTLLFVATENGHLDIVKYLVSMGANLKIKDTNGNKILYYAINSKNKLNNQWVENVNLVTFLIEKGAKCNLKNKYGETLLMNACSRDYLKIAQLLVENGAKVKSKTKNGKTAQFFAAQSGNKILVEYLSSKITQ